MSEREREYVEPVYEEEVEETKEVYSSKPLKRLVKIEKPKYKKKAKLDIVSVEVKSGQ